MRGASSARLCRSGVQGGLFDVGVEAVGEEALAHGFGVFPVGEGTQLKVEEFVLGLVTDDDRVAAALQG